MPQPTTVAPDTALQTGPHTGSETGPETAPGATTDTTTDAPVASPVPTSDAAPRQAVATPDGVVAEDLLVEEVSIDGMCGVY